MRAPGGVYLSLAPEEGWMIHRRTSPRRGLCLPKIAFYGGR